MSELRDAEFSSCRTYRYRLWRIWDRGPLCCFIMLNPSTADEETNDPTIDRCVKRAKDWGYGGLEVVNLFALRATDPKELYPDDEHKRPDPIGPDNNMAIRWATRAAGIVICAWGGHGKLANRGLRVRRMLHRNGVEMHCLKMNVDGEPAHPLYLPYSLRPMRLP